MPEERRERFEALYSSTRARILAYALRRVPSEQDAADILAETFTVAWRRFDEVPDGDEAILWLYGVARNVLRNYQRSRQRQSRLVEDIAHQVSEARWSVLPRDEDRLVALFCLRALEEEDREVLMLTSWEGLSPKAVLSDPVDESSLEAVVESEPFRVLLEQIVSRTDDIVLDQPVPLTARPEHKGHSRRSYVGLAAAVVALLGILAGTGVLGRSGGSIRPFSTPWQQERLFLSGKSGHGGGIWQLVGDFSSGTWTQNDYGPPPGYLTCASPGRCYVMAGKYSSPDVGAPLLSESLYVSIDQGANWGVLPMPAGFAPTTALSCSTPMWCAAGGTYEGQAVLLTTSDGGHSFRVTPLPSGAGKLYALDCPSPGSCDGLVAGSKAPGTGPLDARFLSVRDGGALLRVRPILPGDSMVDLACVSARRCTVIGERDTSINALVPTGVVALTNDAGRTWRAGRVPEGLGIQGQFSSLACTQAGRCYLIGEVAIRKPAECSTSVAHGVAPTASKASLSGFPMAPAIRRLAVDESRIASQWARRTEGFRHTYSCSSPRHSVVNVIASSTNRGMTWTPMALPGNVPMPQLYGLACPSDSQCWAAGSEAIPQSIGIGADQGSPVLLGTTNAGATWSKVTFTMGSGAPNPHGQSYLAIGSISCPSAKVCLAQGIAAQGAGVSPIYALVTSSH